MYCNQVKQWQRVKYVYSCLHPEKGVHITLIQSQCFLEDMPNQTLVAALVATTLFDHEPLTQAGNNL